MDKQVQQIQQQAQHQITQVKMDAHDNMTFMRKQMEMQAQSFGTFFTDLVIALQLEGDIDEIGVLEAVKELRRNAGTN